MLSKLVSSRRGNDLQYTEMPWQTLATEETTKIPAGMGTSPIHTREQEDRELQAQIEVRVRQAYEKGRLEGEAQARQAGQAALESQIQSLAGALCEVSELRSRFRSEAESDLVRLALAIARRIIGREINVDPDAIAGIARTALEKIRTQEIIRVRVVAEHADALKKFLNNVGTSLIEVNVDPRLKRGDILFETTRGAFDVSIDAQLREIERGLTDRLEASKI